VQLVHRPESERKKNQRGNEDGIGDHWFPFRREA
jgi:hypothetical protein